MAEMFISKRACFPHGQQRKFLETSRTTLGVSYCSLAKLLHISTRTLADWRREKFSMSFRATKLLSQKSSVAPPQTIEVRSPFWYAALGAKLGGVAVYKKYGSVGGNPEIRKKKWYRWWHRIGRFKKHPIINISLPLRKPRTSRKLAELVGILLGDGGISTYQVTITLHHKDDREYSIFVISLLKHLFGVTPSVYHDAKNSVYDIVISRIALVKFCTEKLGLKKGNKVKQQVAVPAWIKQNKQFRIACLRGLIDTDGSVFTHRYKVNRKWYQYKKLSFTSLSRPLAIFVYRTLQEIDLHPRLSRNKDVRLENSKEVPMYFHKIGTHNPKHLKRFNG